MAQVVTASEQSSYVLEARGITKRFPGVLANDSIGLRLQRGKILALLGENGAGKSTLMNILYGLYQPDDGELLLDGQPVHFSSPLDAISKGIGMVHQHFMLIPPFTVTENIMLGNESTAGPSLDRKAAARRILALSQQYGLAVNPDALVRDLSVGEQQRVEILKAFYRNADVLILDEPTAVLTPQEADELFVIMRELTKQGKSIIFITHKLKEVLAVADHILVLRRGKVVGEAEPHRTSEGGLAALMVGRNVNLTVAKAPATPGPIVLKVERLKVARDRAARVGDASYAVNNVSFEVRAGEILGIAGVEGNGQSELVEALTGLRRSAYGAVRLNGKDLSNQTPRYITSSGVAHVPEDRHKFGLVLNYPIADNLVLADYYAPPYANGIAINNQAIADHATKLVREFDVRTPSIYTPAKNLSGGNQQKVVVARELSRHNALLIASQPTRGLDVGSIEFIHKSIVAARDSGVAVLLVSAELDEILALADRIAVMYKGQLVATIPRSDANRELLGLLMAGGSLEEAYEATAG